MLHIIHEFGGVENLKGKKLAMTWAYSPSYGKPLSVPQGIIGLMTRFGMDVVLAHPEGYEVFEDVEKVAEENAKKSGGSFKKTNNMAEAFKDADIVYPKSWAPFAAMENVQSFTETEIQKVSKLLRKNFLLRMQSTKTGLVQKSSWLQQKTEKLFTCTVCQLTSQA